MDKMGRFLKELKGQNVPLAKPCKVAKAQNGPLANLDDIAKFINESKTGTKRILKLNDLIPQLILHLCYKYYSYIKYSFNTCQKIGLAAFIIGERIKKLPVD